MKAILRRLRRFGRVLAGREFVAKPNRIYPTERFGSGYGGWEVVPKDIDRDSIVYSFGVGEDASFDIELINRFGLTVHAFDPTPKSTDWVRKQDLSDNFVMHEYGLAARDGIVAFNPPINPNHISHTLLDREATRANAISVPVKRLSTIMTELGHDRLDILKMDIEGAEYQVISDIENSEIRPQQILVEFHHRFPGVGIAKTKEAIAILKSIGYELYAVSSSNEEFCFIRKLVAV